MNLTLNTNENNIIKFTIGISGTSSSPSKVRVFIGSPEKKLCFIGKPTGIEKEWCAEIPPLTELLNYTAGPLFCSIEIVVNGRTFTPYNKEVNLTASETIDMSIITVSPGEKTKEQPTFSEPSQEPIKVLAPIAMEPVQTEIVPEQQIKENADIKFISHYKKDNVEYSLWYKGQNWHELTYSSAGDKPLELVKDWHNKTKKEIHNELINDGYKLIKEEIKVKPLLKDIASITEPVKIVKEEKVKPKKQFKLKPFNTRKKSKVKQDDKSLKDIMVIEDIDLSKISIPTPIIHKTGNSIPFKLIKKNVVYR